MQPLDPFDELARVSRTLRDGLALLDRSATALDQDVSGEDPGLKAAWEKVSAALLKSPSIEALQEVVAAERRSEFDAELAEVARLNAVFSALVTKTQEEVAIRLRSVRESRRGLAYYGSVTGEGERCDISG